MAEIEQGLAEAVSEVPVAVGATNENALIVFASPANTFTIVVLHPDGIGCMVATGEGWHALKSRPAEPKGQGS